MTQFLDELCGNINRPITVYCDNQSAIQLGTVEAFRERSKHIDIKHHHIRERVEEKAIKLQYISTLEMTADELTKPLTGERTRKMAGKMAEKMGLRFDKNDEASCSTAK